MTKHNEIRHILAKCAKCKTPEQYSYIHNFISDSEYLHHIIEDRCNGCQCDDFGMCLNTDDDNFFFMCLPRMVRLLEEDLLTSGINSVYSSHNTIFCLIGFFLSLFGEVVTKGLPVFSSISPGDGYSNNL